MLAIKIRPVFWSSTNKLTEVWVILCMICFCLNNGIYLKIIWFIFALLIEIKLMSKSTKRDEAHMNCHFSVLSCRKISLYKTNIFEMLNKCELFTNVSFFLHTANGLKTTHCEALKFDPTSSKCTNRLVFTRKSPTTTKYQSIILIWTRPYSFRLHGTLE